VRKKKERKKSLSDADDLMQQTIISTYYLYPLFHFSWFTYFLHA